MGGGYNVIANASKIGELGGPTVGTLFLAGTIGGMVGGLIDNPAVAAGASGALTSGITAYESGKSISDSIAAAVVSGGINAVAGGIAGKALTAIGVDNITQFVGGTAAGILGVGYRQCCSSRCRRSFRKWNLPLINCSRPISTEKNRLLHQEG